MRMTLDLNLDYLGGESGAGGEAVLILVDDIRIFQ